MNGELNVAPSCRLPRHSAHLMRDVYTYIQLLEVVVMFNIDLLPPETRLFVQHRQREAMISLTLNRSTDVHAMHQRCFWRALWKRMHE